MTIDENGDYWSAVVRVSEAIRKTIRKIGEKFGERLNNVFCLKRLSLIHSFIAMLFVKNCERTLF